MAGDQAQSITLATADLAAFVADHYDRLLRLARLICGNGGDAGDAVQIALEHAWRRRDALRDDQRLRSWLDRIVVREAIRVARGRRTRLARFLSRDGEVQWAEPADTSFERLPELTGLRQAFRRLPAEQRAVVALHLYLGYPVDQTARLVGAPLETVRSRLRLARERLRRELEERVE